jgi:hypothetical protein
MDSWPVPGHRLQVEGCVFAGLVAQSSSFGSVLYFSSEVETVLVFGVRICFC